MPTAEAGFVSRLRSELQIAPQNTNANPNARSFRECPAAREYSESTGTAGTPARRGGTQASSNSYGRPLATTKVTAMARNAANAACAAALAYACASPKLSSHKTGWLAGSTNIHEGLLCPWVSSEVNPPVLPFVRVNSALQSSFKIIKVLPLPWLWRARALSSTSEGEQLGIGGVPPLCQCSFSTQHGR